MTNHQNGPPGLEVGPRPGHHPETEDADTTITSTTVTSKAGRHCHDIASEYAAGLRRRRAASYRLPVLEHCGRSDPWYYDPPGQRGLQEACAHLLAHGLTPPPHWELSA